MKKMDQLGVVVSLLDAPASNSRSCLVRSTFGPAKMVHRCCEGDDRSTSRTAVIEYGRRPCATGQETTNWHKLF